MSEVQNWYNTKRDNLIKEFEDYRAEPYLDSEDIPTIGYGTTYYPDGRAVTLEDDPISEAKAQEFLQHHIKKFSDQIKTAPGFSDLDTATQSALTSFAYNTGPNVFTAPEGYETLQGAVKSGDKQQIADAIRLYNNNGLAGLVRRREAEVDLMNTTYPALEKFQGITDKFNAIDKTPAAEWRPSQQMPFHRF